MEDILITRNVCDLENAVSEEIITNGLFSFCVLSLVWVHTTECLRLAQGSVLKDLYLGLGLGVGGHMQCQRSNLRQLQAR